MAIAHEADHGSATNAASSTTIAVTTTSAVASSRRIILVLAWFANGVTLSSVSGGGLTWVIDQQGVDQDRHLAFVSADAPSGLASGTAITATFSGAATDRGIFVSSWSGIETGSSGYLGTAGSGFSTSTAWTTGSRTISAGSLLLGGSHEDNSGDHSSTPTSPSVELCDLTLSAFDDATAAYRIETSAGSYAVAGTWSSGASRSVTLWAEYLAASGGSSPQTVNPSALASASAFGTPTAAPGGVSESVSGLASASSFGSPAAEAGGISVEVSGLASQSTFGTPTIVPGGTTVEVSGLDSASSFGSVSVDGSQNVPVSGLSSASSFGTPAIATGGTAVEVEGLNSASQFGVPGTEGGVPASFHPAIHGGKHR